MAGSNPHSSSLHSGGAHIPVRPSKDQRIKAAGSSSAGEKEVRKVKAVEEGLSQDGETEEDEEMTTKSMRGVMYRDDMTDEERAMWWKANRKEAEEFAMAEKRR